MKVKNGGFSRESVRQIKTGYFFIAPWLIGLVLFNLFPIIAVFFLSLTDYPIIGAPKFSGTANFERLFSQDPLFWKAIENTLIYVAFRVPLIQIVAFFLATLLSRKLRFKSLFRAGLYLPVMVPIVAKSVIWRFLLGRVGFLNYALFWLGLPAINLLSSTFWVKPILVSFSLWAVGVPMIIYLAGILGIPKHLYESADIDGAKPWHKLFRITIPMLTPVILLNVVTDIINSFQVFTPAFIITDGGPMNASLFYVLYIFKSGFEHYRMGYASALATVLFFIVLVFTVLFLKWSESWVQYDQV